MTLINLSLLGGLLLAGVPVLLHMMMRAKPKRIEFPALRLLQARKSSNSRRMRLRHLLLLILRGTVIAVAALALTRPSLPAAQYGLRWYEWALLVAVIIASVGTYQWVARKAAEQVSAEHLLRERQGRLRAFSVLGGLLAVILCVGLPWGIRVQGEITAPRNPIAANVPVAAVFIFDTSLSMTYKHESRTRLEHAGQIAIEHLSVLPADSRVAVSTTSAESDVVFQADLAGVRSRIEDLRPQAAPRSLNTLIEDSIEAHLADREEIQQQISTGDLFSREIYLLTDLSKTAWQHPDESGLKNLLIQHNWLQIYLVDVSVPNPVNYSLSQLRLDREATSGDLPVRISVAASATAAAEPAATIELFTQGLDGNEVSGGGAGGSARKRVAFAGSPPVLTFPVAGDPKQKLQKGFIRFSGADPMPFDDIRYFSFGVSDVPRVLLVGDSDDDCWYFRNAFQPVEYDRIKMVRFHQKTVGGTAFRKENLSDYDIICIMNWRRPPDSAWADLHRYVSDGGALFVSTGGDGHLLEAGAWRTPDAESLLPGLPLLPLMFRPEPARLTAAATDHSIVSSFLKNPDAVTELSRPIFERSWSFDWAKQARVLLEFNDRTRRPALVERAVGAGRVLLFTSAIDNRGSNRWNEDFVAGDSWAFLMLVDQIMAYLTGAADTTRNYTVGDSVEIPVPPTDRFSVYRVSRPRFRRTEGTLPFDENSVLLDDVDEAGHYQLRSADEGSNFAADFCANGIDRESDLTPLEDEMLESILGVDRFSRVTDPNQLDRAVNLGRMGVEVYPVLMGLLILLFCAEHLMANFFYDEQSQPGSKASSSPTV